MLDERSLEIEIPAGIHDGQRIRLSGEGHAGPVGGQSGDLYVLVRIRPHERLVREGDDIFSTVDLTMTQAALGAKVEVGTLDGEVELEFEPGTQPGELRVLRGRGMPVLQGFGRGDQRVLVNVADAPPAQRGAAQPARRVRAPRDREDLPLRRGLLREAEERLPLSLVRASVVVPRDRIEEATARMLELFPEGFAEQPAGEAVELVAFTDEAGAGRLRESFGAVASSPVAPGWEDEWKRFHVPAVVGSLWIGPPWEQPPPELTAVVIDPGQAFGTGAHPTTRLCLEFLVGLERGSLLDVGCGSGVLAIAAARLGFGPVFAIDTDPAAIEATTRNAAANGIRAGAPGWPMHAPIG